MGWAPRGQGYLVAASRVARVRLRPTEPSGVNRLGSMRVSRRSDWALPSKPPQSWANSFSACSPLCPNGGWPRSWERQAASTRSGSQPRAAPSSRPTWAHSREWVRRVRGLASHTWLCSPGVTTCVLPGEAAQRRGVQHACPVALEGGAARTLVGLGGPALDGRRVVPGGREVVRGRVGRAGRDAFHEPTVAPAGDVPDTGGPLRPSRGRPARRPGPRCAAPGRSGGGADGPSRGGCPAGRRRCRGRPGALGGEPAGRGEAGGDGDPGAPAGGEGADRVGHGGRGGGGVGGDDGHAEPGGEQGGDALGVGAGRGGAGPRGGQHHGAAAALLRTRGACQPASVSRACRASTSRGARRAGRRRGWAGAPPAAASGMSRVTWWPRPNSSGTSTADPAPDAASSSRVPGSSGAFSSMCPRCTGRPGRRARTRSSSRRAVTRARGSRLPWATTTRAGAGRPGGAGCRGASDTPSCSERDRTRLPCRCAGVTGVCGVFTRGRRAV